MCGISLVFTSQYRRRFNVSVKAVRQIRVSSRSMFEPVLIGCLRVVFDV